MADTVKRKTIIHSLRVLVQFCRSGACYQSRNPYGIQAIKQALQVLAEIDGLSDYLEVKYDTALLPPDSLAYVNEGG